MISKIISRAACRMELISNPKSFLNCPDLHGGSGVPEGTFRSEDIRLLDPAGNLEGNGNGIRSIASLSEIQLAV